MAADAPVGHSKEASTGTGQVMNSQKKHMEARRCAARAQWLLLQPATLDPFDWLALACSIVDADKFLQQAQELDPSIRLPLLEAVLEELRDVTANFTRPDFLSATGGIRRDHPKLFKPRR